MQAFQRHKNNSDYMHYLWQKDERTLAGNLQNRRYSFLPPPPILLSLSSLFSRLRFNDMVLTVEKLRIYSNVSCGKGKDCQKQNQIWKAPASHYFTRLLVIYVTSGTSARRNEAAD
jgi:hypothetical protein